MKRSAQRGFTLVELMMVVAIIAVLAGVLFGTATRPYNANAQTLADSVSSTLQYARTRAIATRKVHRVRIFTASDGEQAVEIATALTTGMAYDAVTTTFGAIEIKRVPHSAIIWAAVAGVADPIDDDHDAIARSSATYDIYFKPDGSGDASTIYLTDQGGTPRFYRVVVFRVTGSTYARQGW